MFLQKKDEERVAKYKQELAQIEEDIKKVIKAAEEVRLLFNRVNL